MSIYVGIDLGASTVKAVVLEGESGEVLGRALGRSGFDPRRAVRAVLEAALEGLGEPNVVALWATGAGRKEVPGAAGTLTEVSCAARAAAHLLPGVATVIDVGAEEARALRLGPAGRVLDFAVNEKCASGTGAFTEAVARALDISLDELGPLSLQSSQELQINTQCAVFAESEVVSLIHQNVPAADIAQAVHRAIAARVAAMTRRVGLEPPVALLGGMAKNSGFVRTLARALRIEAEALQVPPDPQLAGALGAALAASEQRR